MIKASKLCCANCVAPRNLPHGFACVAAADRLALLVVGEFRLAPHLDAVRLGSLAAFAGAGADQFAFELGKPA